jgi:hypothetical protein
MIPHDELQGWCSELEAEALRTAALHANVLEIGTWKARSTVHMAQVAKHVITIDHFRGDRWTGAANTLPEAWANLDRFAVRDRVTLIAADFRVVVPLLDLARIMLFYYDADHSYEATVAALELVVPRLPDRAAIAVHDYDYPDVARAVRELKDERRMSLTVWDRLAMLTPCASHVFALPTADRA